MRNTKDEKESLQIAKKFIGFVKAFENFTNDPDMIFEDIDMLLSKYQNLGLTYDQKCECETMAFKLQQYISGLSQD